jgi:hypothetical protein
VQVRLKLGTLYSRKSELGSGHAPFLGQTVLCNVKQRF